MRPPRLRGNNDLIQILWVVAAVVTITLFLLGHLRTRRDLYSVARERSYTAFQSRELQEQARHLRLEERIREAGVRREEAPSDYRPAPAERTLRVQAPVEIPLAAPDETPWEDAP